MTADDAIIRALIDFQAALDKLSNPSMIIGGIAVIARGVPRTTHDIDGTIWGEALSLEETASLLDQHGIVPRMSDAIEFAKKNQVLLLEHQSSKTPIELTIAWLPFEREALSRATRERFANVDIAAAQVADLVVMKAVAWRPRDQDDVVRLLAHHPLPDDTMKNIRQLVIEFATLLDDPDRINEFDKLVAKAKSAV